MKLRQKIATIFTISAISLITIVSFCFSYFSDSMQTPLEVTSGEGNYLRDLPLGSAIQIRGKQGAIYKFVKMSARDKNGQPTLHPDDPQATYWMMADNYCAIANTPTQCKPGGGNPKGQIMSGGASNSWNTVMASASGVYNTVLKPMYEDINDSNNPNPASGAETIDELAKPSAILDYNYDMDPIGLVMTGQNTVDPCVMTTNSALGIDATNCTWRTKLSLVSYQDWQNGLGGLSDYPSDTSPSCLYKKTLFGAGINCQTTFGLFGFIATPPAGTTPWLPWMRNAQGSSNARFRIVSGVGVEYSSGSAAISEAYGVSPVMWLEGNIKYYCGSGTYSNPYKLNYGCN